MKEFKFDNGDEVQDIVTKIKGIIVSRGDYLTGCYRYGIQQPMTKKDTQPSEWVYVDEHILKLIKKEKVKPFDTDDDGGQQPDKSKHNR